MKKTIIIFGSTGQDGFYLNELLSNENFEVINISRTSGNYIGSVSDFEFVDNLINLKKPQYIFHFAANSSTNHDVTLENNLTISTGTINILESVRRHSIDSKVFISGSALQFKNCGVPINEETPFEYSTTYGISRVYSVHMARYYRENFGIKVYVGYFFNHDSPLRSIKHINQKVVNHVIKVINGCNEKLEIGNLDVKKEFNFAKDIIHAVWILVNQDNLYEAVIGSGIAYTIRDWVNYCFEKYSLNWKDFIVVDKNYQSSYEILISEPKKIKQLGWEPRTNINELADLMLDSELKKYNFRNATPLTIKN